MRSKRYSEGQIRIKLDNAILKAGSQAAFADLHGLSRQYITDILRGRRGLSDKVLAILGFVRVIEFEAHNDQKT